MSHEVEEEVSLRNRDDFVGDFDEEAESLARPQVEALRDALAEVLRPRRRVDLERLKGTRVMKSIYRSQKLVDEICSTPDGYVG